VKVMFEHLNQRKIRAFLPHRFPFLLVDVVEEIRVPEGQDPLDGNPKSQVGIQVTAIKNVTANEPHFQGHFPDVPVMPGVMILETMAQVASFAVYPSVEPLLRNNERFQCVLVGVDEARFRIPVVPGDTLKITTEVISCRSQLWHFSCVATVRDKKVAEAKILANLIPESTGRTVF